MLLGCLRAAPDRAAHRSFASDNAAGAHPAVLDAIVAANTGHALAYGDDRWTARVRGAVPRPVRRRGESFLVWNGTGANVMALAPMLRPAEAVVCTDWAHIAVDETGAPRARPRRQADRPSPRTADAQAASRADRRARPDLFGSDTPRPAGGGVDHPEHRARHRVHAPTRSPRSCDAAHRLGMLVHMDGARIANATAALGGTVATLRSFTVDAGVDVLTFGGTKAGLARRRGRRLPRPGARRARQVRAQAGHPAAVEDALRRRPVHRPARRRPVDRLAAHANAMAGRLYDAVTASPASTSIAPAVNSVFPMLPGRRSSRCRSGASSGTGMSPAARCAG